MGEDGGARHGAVVELRTSDAVALTHVVGPGAPLGDDAAAVARTKAPSAAAAAAWRPTGGPLRWRARSPRL